MRVHACMPVRMAVGLSGRMPAHLQVSQSAIRQASRVAIHSTTQSVNHGVCMSAWLYICMMVSIDACIHACRCWLLSCCLVYCMSVRRPVWMYVYPSAWVHDGLSDGMRASMAAFRCVCMWTCPPALMSVSPGMSIPLDNGL